MRDKSEAKHTPGPWKISQWKDTRLADGFETVISDSRGHGLVSFCQKGKNKKVEANARLIAAAPEMIAALRAIVARINGVWDDPDLMAFGPLSTESADIEAIASQAIAKATGA